MIWGIVLMVSLGVILLAAELFTNGVEWVGYRLNLGEGIVGSVLAAVGTAMPETLIPIVAIVFLGEHAANEVGIGAILGAPFMLATLAMFVVGTSVMVFTRTGRRTDEVKADAVVLSRDITFFLAAYAVAIIAGFIDLVWVKWVLAALMIIMYCYYVFRHFSDECEQGSEPKPLHACIYLPVGHSRLAGRPMESIVHLYFAEYAIPEGGVVAEEAVGAEGGRWLGSTTPLYFINQAVPRLYMCIGQTVGALVLMVAGAWIFIQSVEHVSSAIGIPALILSLIVAPVATELPEKFNSVLWVRIGKDTLAMGNITGAMVFQSCIPAAIGIAFTQWAISDSTPALISALIALASTTVIFGLGRLRRRLSAPVLMIGGLFYAAYLSYLLVAVIR